MTDALLFLHLLSVATLVAGLAAFCAAVLGARLEPGAVRIFVALWNAGMVGVLLFGLALAIDIDAYDPWDAWVLIAIGLWLAAGGIGDQVARGLRDAAGDGAALPARLARLNWVLLVLVVLLLADMVWKPWA